MSAPRRTTRPTRADQPIAEVELDDDLARLVRRTSVLRQGFYIVVLMVALAGQVSGAVETLGIPLLAAVPAVSALELGGIVVLANADVRRRLGERAVASRLLSVAIAASAVTFNWLAHKDHLLGGFFAGMSALGYLVWLMHTENQRRDRLRTKGNLPPTTPAYEMIGHWLRHPWLTTRARALAKADPRLDLYRSLASARADIRRERRQAAIAKVLHRKIRAAVDPRTADIAIAVYDLDEIAARLADRADYDGLTDLIAADMAPARLAPDGLLIERAATGPKRRSPIAALTTRREEITQLELPGTDIVGAVQATARRGIPAQAAPIEPAHVGPAHTGSANLGPANPGPAGSGSVRIEPASAGSRPGVPAQAARARAGQPEPMRQPTPQPIPHDAHRANGVPTNGNATNGNPINGNVVDGGLINGSPANGSPANGNAVNAHATNGVTINAANGSGQRNGHVEPFGTGFDGPIQSSLFTDLRPDFDHTPQPKPIADYSGRVADGYPDEAISPAQQAATDKSLRRRVHAALDATVLPGDQRDDTELVSLVFDELGLTDVERLSAQNFVRSWLLDTRTGARIRTA